MKKIITRALTGSVFVALTIGAVLIDPLFFAGLYLVFCVIGFIEFYKLSGNGELQPQIVPGILAGVIAYLVIAMLSRDMLHPVWLFCLIPIFFIIFIVELYRKHESPFQNIAITLLPVFYIAVPLAMLSFLFNRWTLTGEFYPNILLGFFIITWVGDTMAYLGGMAFGRHPLFERISPKKTWEGSFSGALFSIGAALFISIFFKEFTALQWAGMAVIIIVTGTFGDLAESLLKRSALVKDSGSLLPGHGGVLDRLDGVIFSAPFVFLYIILLNHL